MDREEIILQIGKGKSQKKSIYEPSMNSESMKQKFSTLITVSCNTWSDIIFNTFYESIPGKIKKEK